MDFIDVIKFNESVDNNWLIYRFPMKNFVYGTQLRVGDGQVAIFVKEERALDYFTPGNYILNAKNLPLLQSTMNTPFEGRTPFKADLIFINSTAKMSVFWGTSKPIPLIGVQSSKGSKVSASGKFAMRILNYSKFLTKLTSSMGNEKIVKYDLVVDYFKGIILTKARAVISDMISNEKISMSDIEVRISDISKIIKKWIKERFNDFGIEILEFSIASMKFSDSI